MRRFYFTLVFTCLSLIGVAKATKVLLVPLDDRPPCLQFTVRMGAIGNVEVVVPPRELLGKFTKAGDPEQIIRWIRSQDLNSYKAIIISMDMLAYGGLVASRVHQSSKETALSRLAIIEEIKKKSPKVPIYGQSVIMRLAPTSDGKNEAYREKLARWADLSPYKEHTEEVRKLENEIPADALNNYKQARQRNLAVNQAAIKLTQTGVLDYLILSQDDAKPRGIHVSDREQLISEIATKRLSEKIIVQPGTDEISMLLLSRALNRINRFVPSVFVKYSSEGAANTAMPFEDRPLRQTVSYNIIAAGGKETTVEDNVDLLFYVFASRFDQGIAESFASDIAKKISEGKRVMVADVDPKGNTQGGDSTFTRALLQRKLFTELYSYASWNTAGNTIGTALPQGMIFRLAQTKSMTNPVITEKLWQAQNWFTFHRLLDDYAFHTVVRPKANEYFKQSNRSGFERTEDVARQVENYSYKLLLPMFDKMKMIYQEKPANSIQRNIQYLPTNLKLNLPWNRTFEAEIEFD